MAHKVLVDGTGYAVKGGKTLIGGTGYSIKRGRTLVDGAGYNICFAPLKTTLTVAAEISEWDEYISISVNGTEVGLFYVQVEQSFSCQVMEGDVVTVTSNGYMVPKDYSGMTNVTTKNGRQVEGIVVKNPYILYTDIAC